MPTRALPASNSSSPRCWGKMAYFTGPKNADCAPIRNSTANSSQRAPNQKAAAPSSMIRISASLIRRIISDFSYLSANWPARAENRKKGRINRPAARLTTVLTLAAPAILALTIITRSAFLNRLSLRAPKNWVRKSGRNRRAFISSLLLLLTRTSFLFLRLTYCRCTQCYSMTLPEHPTAAHNQPQALSGLP